jgi:fructokinase
MALVFHGVGDLRLEDRPTPTAGPGDVVVRPLLTGICGTDRGIYLGHARCVTPRVLGHECIGIIEVAGARVSDVAAGDRVVISPTMWCGYCGPCRAGHGYRCLRKGELEMGVGCDGAAAEFVGLPARFVHRLPPDLPDRRAVLLEPLACVLAGLANVRLSPPDRVLILGGGPVGALCAMVAARLTAAVALRESDPYRRDFASKNLPGVTLSDGTVDHHDLPPTVVVDTTGALTEVALGTVEDGGGVLLLGIHTGYGATLRPFDLTARNLTLVGSSDYNQFDFPGVIEFARTLPCEALVTHLLPLVESLHAFDLLAVRPGADYQAMKVALTIGCT